MLEISGGDKFPFVEAQRDYFYNNPVISWTTYDHAFFPVGYVVLPNGEHGFLNIRVHNSGTIQNVDFNVVKREQSNATPSSDDDYNWDYLSIGLSYGHTEEQILTTGGSAHFDRIASLSDEGFLLTLFHSMGIQTSFSGDLDLLGFGDAGIVINTQTAGVTTTTDKAKFLWDNSADQQKFKLMLGDDLADISLDELSSSKLVVPNGDGVVIGTAPLGTYADFSNALATAKE